MQKAPESGSETQVIRDLGRTLHKQFTNMAAIPGHRQTYIYRVIGAVAILRREKMFHLLFIFLLWDQLSSALSQFNDRIFKDS